MNTARFSLFISLIAAGLCFAAILLNSRVNFLLPAAITAISSSLLLTFLSFMILNRGIGFTGYKFVTYVLGGTGLKLVASIILILIVYFVEKSYLKTFVVSYFFSYLIFTSFEIAVIMRNLRRNLKN